MKDATSTARVEPWYVRALEAMRLPPVTDKAEVDRALDEAERHYADLWDGGGTAGSDALRVLRALRSLRGKPEADWELEADAAPTRALARLRAAGWTVGVHNDYRLGGVAHTFWLMTHTDGTFMREEGTTDAGALIRLAERAGV